MKTRFKHAMDGYRKLTVKDVRRVITIFVVVLSCSVFINISEAYGATDYNVAWMNSFQKALTDQNQQLIASNNQASFYINTNYVNIERGKSENKVDVWLFAWRNQPDSDNQKLIGQRVRTLFKANKRQTKVLSYVTLDPSGNVVNYAFNQIGSKRDVVAGSVYDRMCDYIEYCWLR